MFKFGGRWFYLPSFFIFMVIVAGHWEFSWSTPSEEIRYWEGVVREFGVDRFVMTPVTGMRKKYVEEVHDLRAFIEQWEGDVIFCSEEGEEDLNGFDHPKDNVMYVFGKGTYSPFNNMKRPQDRSVKIETLANKALMLAPVAASIILYDRSKQWH